jgi:uncharacterized protein (TIGR02246 family)
MSSRRKLFPTPDDAETAFYDAFERSDLAAMMAVWAASDDVVCIHPTGPRLQGFESVRDSWSQIFSGGSQLRVRLAEVKKFDGQSVAVRAVMEILTASGSQSGNSQTVLATNVYELGDGGWRMVIHHACPMPEASAPADDSSPSHTLH